MSKKILYHFELRASIKNLAGDLIDNINENMKAFGSDEKIDITALLASPIVTVDHELNDDEFEKVFKALKMGCIDVFGSKAEIKFIRKSYEDRN